MINGGRVVLYSKDAEADRQFFKNVLKFKYVDVDARISPATRDRNVLSVSKAGLRRPMNHKSGRSQS